MGGHDFSFLSQHCAATQSGHRWRHACGCGFSAGFGGLSPDWAFWSCSSVEKGGHGSELASLALRYDDAGPPFRARPPIGDWIDSASSPPRAISHEITEFGITPLR
jgi:hypothetical protein